MRLVLALLCLVGLAASPCAQPDHAAAAASQNDRLEPPALAEYEGRYEYHGGTALAIVAGRGMLFAVIDDAKYPLRPAGRDTFVNNAGEAIPFPRDAGGRVSGFEERGVFFRRLSTEVDAVVAAVVRSRPRPPGKDGRPAPYVYAPPVELPDGLPVGRAAHAGLQAPSVDRLVSRIVDGTYPDVHAVLVQRAGKLVLEEYFYGYDGGRMHQMRSLSKSIVSALVGIGIDRGVLAGDGDLVTKRLAYEQYANPDPRKDRLTLRDLLTMQSGLACDDWDGESPGNESRVYQSADWVKYVLDLPVVTPPGSQGRYCSGNVLVAGRVLERAAGTPLPAFAQEHLFAPLGIRAGDVRWNFTLDSSNASFAQLYLRPRDMLKIGMLFHQQGRWGGRQVISREWVEKSTARWSTIGDQGYGYFWWHQYANASTPDGPRRVDMIVATGNGGQKIYIVPSLDLIVVITGGSYNANSPAMTIMARELLPALLSQASGADAMRE